MDDGYQTRFQGQGDHLLNRVDLARLITPENYALEREQIFRRAWMPIAHTSDVPEKGSYFVYDVPTFNASLLVVRGRDDRIRVFHNACRHRANRIVREGSGCSQALVCKFHGWAFTPEGDLAGITDESQFRNVDKSTLGLVPVHSEVWESFIFVNFDSKPRYSLAAWLGPFHGQYSGYFDEHENVTSHRVELNCNWHLGVNSFTEGYHTLYLHKSTARDYQGGKANPNRRRPSMEIFERHHRYSAPGNPDHVEVPVEKLAIKYGRKILPAFDFDMTGLPPGVNPTRNEHWGFDVVEFFPNFVMLTGNCWHNEIWFWPIDAGRTLALNRGWTYKAKNPAQRASRSYFRSRIRDVFREDLNTLEAQQGALASGAIKEIILSEQEMALQHHYHVTERMMAAA